MTASLEALVIAAYIFADGLAIPRPGPRGNTTRDNHGSDRASKPCEKSLGDPLPSATIDDLAGAP